MNLLAIDTSSRSSVVAVSRRDGAEYLASTPAVHRHGRYFIPTIQKLLREAQIRPLEIEVIAVTTGPGSFTGLRIGLTAAKMLSLASGAPVKGLDALEVLAWGAPGVFQHVCVRIDGQRGQVFAAEFKRSGAGAPPGRVSATRLEIADSEVPVSDGPMYLITVESQRGRREWPSHVVVAPASASEPNPMVLLRVARARVREGPFDDPWTLEPTYFRPSAAEERRAPR